MRLKKLFQTFLILCLIPIGSYKSQADTLVEPKAFIADTQQLHNDNISAIKNALLNNKSASKYITDIDGVSKLVYALHSMYKDEGITAPVLLGLIETESNFNPNAVCYARNGTSYGLMQVTPGTAKGYLHRMGLKTNTKNLFNPYTNLLVGAAILHDYIAVVKRRGISPKNTMDYAFGVYNMGEGGFFGSIKGKQISKTAKKYIALQHKNQKHWVGLINDRY